MNLAKIICLLAAVCLLGGCGAKAPDTQIANPWKDYESLQQAEDAAGFVFGLAQETQDGSTAERFRVLDSRLIEVVYLQGDREVTVRKAAGNEDISGDYNEYSTVTLAEYANGSATIRENKSILVFTNQYSWSVYCAEGFAENEVQQWIEAIFKA